MGFRDVHNDRTVLLQKGLPGMFEVESNHSAEAAHILFLNTRYYCHKQFETNAAAALGPAGNIVKAKARKAEQLKAISFSFVAFAVTFCLRSTGLPSFVRAQCWLAGCVQLRAFTFV